MLTVKEIVEKLGGEISGDGNVRISGFAELGSAGPEQITFFAEEKLRSSFLAARAGCIIVIKPEPEVRACQVVTANPPLYFAGVIKLFYKNPYLSLSGIEPGAQIAENVILEGDNFVGAGAYISSKCRIGKGTKIMQNVFIGANTVIGPGGLIYPNVTIRENISIGNNVIIHPGAVLGADGFGFVRDGRKIVKTEQTGTCIIGDDVEIGANAAIDRATIGATRIGNGTKIDNLVQVGHNVEIGENCFICGQAAIAGSTKIGSNVTLAGQSGVTGHITIGDNVMVAGGAGVTNNIPSGEIVSGFPARPHSQSRKIYAIINRLPELYETIKKLKKKAGE